MNIYCILPLHTLSGKRELTGWVPFTDLCDLGHTAGDVRPGCNLGVVVRHLYVALTEDPVGQEGLDLQVNYLKFSPTLVQQQGSLDTESG